MRRRLVVLVLLALGVIALGGLGTPSAPGQETVGGVIHSRFRTFRIPFNVGAGAAQIRQVQLYVSLDQGQSWQAAANAPPDQRFFRFGAERDGLHWFAVQTLDLDNRLTPPNMQGAAPSLKVMVDTAAPGVHLRTLTPQGDKVGVSWDIRDENLEFLANDTVRLDYRPAGGQNWIPLNLPIGATQLYWVPQAPGPVEVRLQARDRAGNTAQTVATIGLAGNPGFANPNPNPGPNSGLVPPNHAAQPPQGGRAQDLVNGPAEHERKLVNSKRITLSYELKDVGPSGVSAVELWYTVNGRSWNKYPHRFDDPKQTAIAFEVEGEGVYGISLCAKSGVGLGERPPQFGDRPQLWIEVDLTKPAVQLQNVVVGAGTDKGKLFIHWTARDRNLHREPITLSYAEHAAGPWKTFADKLSNANGRHVWTMPESGVPYQFHIKVEAVDQAGNIGEAITDSLVKVDLSTPKVKILTVEPGR
ncbi:MAG: hypothetical protein L0Y71_14740 [Gemmataceae bacterium]|nr:hypothetical protein [Gemmataceae bacterium]